MKEQIKNIKIKLLLLVKRLDELHCNNQNIEIEVKLKAIDEKIYELSDTLESIENLLE